MEGNAISKPIGQIPHRLESSKPPTKLQVKTCGDWWRGEFPDAAVTLFHGFSKSERIAFGWKYYFTLHTNSLVSVS